MKKIILTAITMVLVLVLALLVCGGLFSPAQKGAAVETAEPAYRWGDVPLDQMQVDLLDYANAYLSGEWDGSPIYREDYIDGAYAQFFGDWLYVGRLSGVIPGATTENTSPDGLIQAFEDGEWWHYDDDYVVVYSSDYAEEYSADIADGGGRVYRTNLFRDALYRSYINSSDVSGVNVVVKAKEIGSTDFHDPEYLVEAFREDPDARLWCRETAQVARMRAGSVEVSTLEEWESDWRDGYDWGEWKPAHVFPAVGTP